MNDYEFVKKVKQVVSDYATLRTGDSSDNIVTEDDVYIVWLAKVLQNNKALAGTIYPDGMYYEITYNGDKDELYVDAYTKVHNIKYNNVTNN